jgi:PAS domain S-box-containing protein
MLALNDLVIEGDFRSKLLIDSLTGYAIYLLDRKGVVSTWNTGAERATGYVAEEVVGRHFSMFYTAEDREKGEPLRVLDVAVQDGRFEGSGWRVRKDGSRFWVCLVMEPVTVNGRVVGFAAITRDNTGEHEADERLEAVHRNLKIALTYMSQGLALRCGGSSDPGEPAVMRDVRRLVRAGAGGDEHRGGDGGDRVQQAPGAEAGGAYSLDYAGWADGSGV